MQALGMTGNWFAAFAILAWPIVAIALYRTRPAAEATLWTVLGALLLLPTGVSIKLPMIPAVDKNSVPNLCALIGCICLLPRRERAGSTFGIVEILALLLIFGPVITATFNNDAIVIGDRVLPSVGYYDGISALLSQFVIFLPFFIGRRALRDSSGAETVVRCLVIAGLLYSFPMLLEVRLSPQLSNWVYGFFPSGFSSEVRYGGFRPVVFMKNGLTAAFFMMTTFLAAVALWRVNDRIKSFPSAGLSIYLGTILVLFKSAGALVYAALVGFFVRWMKPRAQLRLAVVLATIGVLYPVLRMTDSFPDKFLVEIAASFDKERADSLQIRFDQERLLLDRASERLAFGWGRYGRNRVYEESGKDSSITDGAWIQTLGQFGLVGFLAQFGLLAWPVFRAASAFKFISTERDRVFLSVIALIVALGVVEQLPNSSISPWNWLLAGALLGRAEQIIQLARRARRPSNGLRVSKVRSGSANA
jgi:hypothetical protein